MISISTKGIDEILLEMGKINTTQFKSIWELQRETRRDIEEILLENEYVSKPDILIAKARRFGVEFVDLSVYEIKDESIPCKVSENIASRYGLIPIDEEDGVLTVAMKDPSDIFALDDLRLATFLEIKPLFADIEEIEALIKKFHTRGTKTINDSNNSVYTNEIYGSFDNNITGSNIQNQIPDDSDSNLSETSLIFSKNRIGELFVNEGILQKEQLEEALSIQQSSGERIGQIFVRQGYITRKILYEFLAMQLDMPHIDLDSINITEDVVKAVSENIARRYTLVPVEISGNSLKVAMSDPMNIFSIDDLRLATGMDIVPVLGDEEQINSILDKYFEKAREIRKTNESKKKLDEFDKEFEKVKEEISVEISSEEVDNEETLDINSVENAPIVKMVNIIFNKAVASGASDIHIEPYEDCVMVRYRVDGQLMETMKHDRKILSALVARVKIISGLNIAEKRVPQDGRLTLKIEGKPYDLRVSVLPTIFGEKIVIRIADKDGFNISKKELGFFDDDLQKFDSILSHPHGIVLVTGPTGSGKSTTLYTALKELCKPSINILTVEDPVECTVRGVNQVQVNVKAGMTFASALRSFLRQDPDIIMVGEIRDSETAEIATRAAITGHLVLSTLHTNDAASSITRMIDMGIESFMMSSSIVGVIAQRLVRKLCLKCKQEYTPGINEAEILNIEKGEDVSIYMPQGCPACNNTGYKGRIAIYEIMEISSEIKELISKNVTSDILKETATKNGMKTLRMNCSRMVKAGITSVEEMLRVTYAKE
ncbi:MAG: ATPase, T2SS/T4P/T4SS family [Clostridia bacterium]|nr:ATPase, T2SS/T4P/T4SS family [Clostridia bacterium]